MVDVIIISDGKDISKIKLTQRCVDSVLAQNGNPIVVESKQVQYTGATVLYPKEKFGYNDYVKFGIRASDNPYIFVINNDTVLQKNCLSNLIKALEVYDTVSPREPNFFQHSKIKNQYQEGFNIWHGFAEFCGWAIMFKRKLLSEIDIDILFHSAFRFWYADNFMAYILNLFKKRHALVRAAELIHYGSLTLKSLGKELRDEFTHEQEAIYFRTIQEVEKIISEKIQ